jgi:hydroxyethylthiazole kinase
MTDLTQAAVAALLRLRQRKPLVHQITNFVVMNCTANITLCAGALPVMAHAPEEAAEMAACAGALVLNIGTLWKEQIEAMILAGRAANQRGIPVVLDPVGAGATRFRTESSRRLLDELQIAIVRGNAAEIAVLAGLDARIAGVESLGAAHDAASIALQFARKHHCVAAVTGPVDYISDGQRLIRVSNGHPLMAQVTGTGCMATAVVASFAAVEPDYAGAAAAALAAYGLAGQIAAERAAGPGTFQMHLFDALAGLTADALLAGARLEVEHP